MLKNAYFLAKIGADTAENERNFAKTWQLPYGSSAVGSASRLPLRSALARRAALPAAGGDGLLGGGADGVPSQLLRVRRPLACQPGLQGGARGPARREPRLRPC